MILSMRVGFRVEEGRLVGLDRGLWRRGGGLVYRCLYRLGDVMMMLLGREHLELEVELILRPGGMIWIEVCVSWLTKESFA